MSKYKRHLFTSDDRSALCRALAFVQSVSAREPHRILPPVWRFNEIKKQKQAFRDIDGSSLDLWRAATPDALPQKPTAVVPYDYIFLGVPQNGHLHIVVRPPDGTTSSSNESNASSVPSFSSHWSPRRDTVRGTPGCGKTTLMKLLHAYILEHAPLALVYTQHSWPGPEEATQKNSSRRERLKEVDPRFPRQDGITFLLFDEGQDTYEDHLLWNAFFKGVGDGLHSHYCVILFCSYCNPSPRPVSYRIGTPVVLRDAARISLWPREGSIGILLTRSEFDEVVSRFHRPLRLHPDLLDMIFDWTVGHVGAVVELLRVISYQRVKETELGEQLTVEAFHAENPTHKLVRSLSGGGFARGLPMDAEVSSDVVELFRNLLKYGAVDRDVKDEDDAIRKCHRYGWIHANQTTKEAITPLDAISKFKPSQLRLPIRSVSDEFYRSIFAITCGNVFVSPEFASAGRVRVPGRIDFVIPVVKWGIEFAQDGNRLNEHSSRFTKSEAYEAWLKSEDMADYILLDCCKSIPRIPFPSKYQSNSSLSICENRFINYLNEKDETLQCLEKLLS
ncbi:hypothetical protein M378DRAFT_180929 [Amanita muscaria Koide BX008]|uniref:Uncharacterized protein n=1 Tax=Amanita muscaria (strain Koide BX008) TaxID=946122 RepID=A0A0C2S8T3_AMAMK|nr:hypothetical protein M378DRAFT_180929 [Amanita muscaria Koide BX008]